MLFILSLVLFFKPREKCENRLFCFDFPRTSITLRPEVLGNIFSFRFDFVLLMSFNLERKIMKTKKLLTFGCNLESKSGDTLSKEMCLHPKARKIQRKSLNFYKDWH